MRLLGFEITRKQSSLTPASSYYGGSGVVGGAYSGFFGRILESFPGAWQKNVEVDAYHNILAFSAVYACVRLIADDISKLRIKLTAYRDGIWEEITTNSPFLGVLAKPNRFQTRIQFLKEWIANKLIHGNAYIYLERDNRGMVAAMYVLDSRAVVPLVASDGAVYYQVKTRYDLAGIGDEAPVIDAKDIIHDRMITMWHPLIGVTPIFACGSAATQGMRIQANSAKFFENMSRPSGQLTAPGAISKETAERLKNLFEANFSGGNIGRLFVGGDGLKYEPMAMAAADAQLIEQLRWTVEDVGRAFGVPLHKISSGQNPTFNNVGALNQDYYTQCLQAHIESIELLLDEGLNLVNVPGVTYGTELDLEGLLRMDPAGRALANKDAIGAGYLTPNEARRRESLKAIDGGDEAYLQQQNWPISQLATRPDAALAPAPVAPHPAPGPPTAPPALPAPGKEMDFDSATEVARTLIVKFARVEDFAAA